MTTTSLNMTTTHLDRDLSFFGTTAASDPNTPLNEIVVRKWELNENSTHYDKLVAAPSDGDLIKFWAGWAGIMLTTAVLCTSIWIPLVFSRPVKKNPFNLYLIYLLTPDMLVAWICGFTCLSNALAGHFTSTFMCQFQSFYMIASICANSWLNAVVAYQLYKMLSSAHRFLRYTPPTHRQVSLQAAGVYAYSMFLALWGNLGFKWWPHKTRLTIGAACIPMDYSHASTAFFYGVFFPLLFGIPLALVCWFGYQIYKHQMLPPSGRRRILAIYFFRLAAVFLIMWLPGLLLLFVTGAWLDPWVEWAGGSWSHLQGAVSALVSLLKPDIWKAVLDFWLCLKSAEDDKNADSGTRSSFFITRWSTRGSALFRSSSFKKSGGRLSNMWASLANKNPLGSFGRTSSTPAPLVSLPIGVSELSDHDKDDNSKDNQSDAEDNDMAGDRSKIRRYLDGVQEEMESQDPLQAQTTSIMSSLRDVTSSVNAAPVMEDESESDKLLDDAVPVNWNDESGALSIDNGKPINWNDLSGELGMKDKDDDDESVITDVCKSEQPVDWNDCDPELGDISLSQKPVDWNDSDPDLGANEEPVNWNESDTEVGLMKSNEDEQRPKPAAPQSLLGGSFSSHEDNSHVMSFQDELDSRASLLSRTSLKSNSSNPLSMGGSLRDEPKRVKQDEDFHGSKSSRF